jgi:hypothetical protein
MWKAHAVSLLHASGEKRKEKEDNWYIQVHKASFKKIKLSSFFDDDSMKLYLLFIFERIYSTVFQTPQRRSK